MADGGAELAAGVAVSDQLDNALVLAQFLRPQSARDEHAVEGLSGDASDAHVRAGRRVILKRVFPRLQPDHRHPGASLLETQAYIVELRGVRSLSEKHCEVQSCHWLSYLHINERPRAPRPRHIGERGRSPSSMGRFGRESTRVPHVPQLGCRAILRRRELRPMARQAASGEANA